MWSSFRLRHLALLTIVALGCVRTPEERAIAYLSQEVPKWKEENRCFSGHDNGDAARALIVAKKNGWEVDDAALDSTWDWLRDPHAWAKGQVTDVFETTDSRAFNSAG